MSTSRDVPASLSPVLPAKKWLRSNGGLLFAFGVVGLWGLCLYLGLTIEHNWYAPWPYLLALLQTHFYAGVFITAHDAMHGTVHRNRKLNNFVGWLCASLFAYNWYPRLHRNHHRHHKHVGTDADPDVYLGRSLPLWYLHFLREYLTLAQFVLMALTFNGLILIFPKTNVIVFWMIPAILATFQIFYFGTWVPHHHPPENVHRSRTLSKGHLYAFFTCYFFGYHYEHHASPGTPWWMLWKMK